MKPIKIFTDTCSDLTEDILKKHDIASINFTIYYNEKEIEATPWTNVKPSELYNTLRYGTRVYTLPATENEIKTKFSKYIDDYDILYIAACEKQSTTISKALKIAKKMNKNANNRIVIIDSLNASIGQGMLVLKACQLRDEGLSIDEISEKIIALRKHVIQYATVDTLTYLSKANKINARSAMLGNLFGIKPILVSDCDGNQVSMAKVKGREKSLERIIDLFLKNIKDPETQDIYIIHGDDLETAKWIKKELEERNLECQSINILCVGPVVGITTGPGMVGLFGFGEEVTFNGELH